jgi:hypothetical protein
MNSWKDWSQKQWDKWGSKLGPAYKRIDAWKTPDYVKKLGDQVWDLLDDAKKKMLYELVMKTIKNFNEDIAKKFIQKVFAYLALLLGRKIKVEDK